MEKLKKVQAELKEGRKEHEQAKVESEGHAWASLQEAKKEIMQQERLAKQIVTDAFTLFAAQN